MSKLNLICQDGYIEKEKIQDAVYKILRQKINLSAEISFCDEQEIRQINKENRNIDSVTDVLSFPSLNLISGEVVKKSNYPFDYDYETKSVFIGSIIICEKRAKEQAEQYNHSLKREMNYLAVHGLLHLFGYDHIEEDDKGKMREMEELILNEIGVSRND